MLFPKSAVIYDVGGGAWPTSEILAHEFRSLKIVIQDRPETYEGGVRVRRYSLSSLILSNLILFLKDLRIEVL